jgi:hypothetical protein
MKEKITTLGIPQKFCKEYHGDCHVCKRGKIRRTDRWKVLNVAYQTQTVTGITSTR